MDQMDQTCKIAELPDMVIKTQFAEADQVKSQRETASIDQAPLLKDSHFALTLDQETKAEILIALQITTDSLITSLSQSAMEQTDLLQLEPAKPLPSVMTSQSAIKATSESHANPLLSVMKPVK